MKLTNITTMSTREIAEITGKLHKNVMRDCKTLNETYEKIDALRIESVDYVDAKNETRPMFILTKMQVMDLMTGYNVELRIKVNRRWEELEKAIPQKSKPELYRDIADALEEKERVAKELAESNALHEENRSKVVFADSVSGCDNSILIRMFAKDLSHDGFVIGQNGLFEWFRENGYLNQKNEPYQLYINQGLFEVLTRTVGNTDSTIQVKTTKITGKGQVYFAKKVKHSFSQN